MRRIAAAFVAVVLAITACSPFDDGSNPFATTATVPATAAPATTDTTSISGTTGPGTTTTPPATDAEGVGSPGLGDPYFPALGNGGYDIGHYTIEVDIDPDDNVITGTTTIQATATADLVGFHLDFGPDMTVLDVTVDGREAGRSQAAEELMVTPPLPLSAGQEFAVEVTYRGSPEARVAPGTGGLSMGWQQTAEGVFAVGEPDASHTWFPANDHPSDKAEFTFRLTVPEPFTAVANGELVETSTAGSATTFVWEMDAPMATYLATVVVAELERVDRGPIDGVALRDYLPADLAAAEPPAFAAISEIIGFLAEVFGPYPFDEYGHVVVPGWPAALETQTISVFGTPAIAERVVVHEAAHQWFGDSVSPATWQHTWLSEGFATYAEWLWIEHNHGTEALEGEVEAARRIMATPHAPIADPGVVELFGRGVYFKGALTLHALRMNVGDDAFFEILRAHAGRFAGASVTTDDFTRLAEEVSGRDLQDLFDRWLRSTELPEAG